MSSNAAVTYSLSQETGLAAELCKLALERSKNDVDAARRVLSAWVKKEPTTTNNFGIVCTYFEKDFDSSAVVEVTCTDEMFAGKKEFYELVSDIATEIVQYEQPYVNEPKMAELEQKLGCRFNVKSERFVRSNPLCLLTTYSHRNKIGAMVETEVTNSDALNHKLLKQFSFDLAMHIVAFAPLAVDADGISDDMKHDLSRKIEKDLMRDGKPLNLWKTVVDGKIKKWSEQRSLLNQIFIKSDKDTVSEVKKKIGDKIGSEITIKRFARIAIGS